MSSLPIALSDWPLHLAVLLGIASGAYFGAFSLLDILLSLLARVSKRRWQMQPLKWLDQFEKRAGALTEDERFGLNRINWDALKLASGASGVAILALFLGGTDYPYLAVLGLAAAFIPSFIRKQMLELARWRLRVEIRDFITELRLAITLNVTVSRALQQVAQRKRETPFAQRLQYHVETTLGVAEPERVLSALAEEFESRDLRELVMLVTAARRGGLALSEALAQSAQSVAQTILAEAEYSVEEMPTELILPMLFCLFPPILVLVLLPIMNQLITTLTGLPSGS